MRRHLAKRAAGVTALATATLLATSANADNVLVWDGGQSHPGIDAAVTRLQGLGHSVTRVSTVPADLSSFDNLWAMDLFNGPDATDERAMVGAFLNSDRGVYAQFEWDCCTASQVNWTETLAPLLVSPFAISGSQGVSQDATAEAAEVFGLTTTPNAIPALQINATANIVTIPDANVVYRLNGTAVVGAYVDPQFASGDGCIVLSGDIEQMTTAPQAAAWIENIQTFLSNCYASPPEVCGDGFIAATEGCDDGNTNDGDGCSSSCASEIGWACTTDLSHDPATTCVADCIGAGDPCSEGRGECAAGGTIVCTSPGVGACDAVPGAPTDEICDGLDNNCDGFNDEGNPEGGATCASGEPGICDEGITSCNAGVLECEPLIPVGSKVEQCDGLDNDCDGAIDEGNPNAGEACSSGEPGVCDPGLTNCNGGKVECLSILQPGFLADTCNGLDDNCDGIVDEGFNVGGQCSDGVGECSATGHLLCAPGGGIMCDAVPREPSPEICDGRDNDCDGAVDEGKPESDIPCSSGEAGVCAAGLTRCSAGVLECTPIVTPGSRVERCNMQDDDCDGSTDESFDVGASCTSGLGICEVVGALICDADGGVVCDAVPHAPKQELCGDALDSDCDGDPNNGCLDVDKDGLSDSFEAKIGTDPNDADSDDDGALDGQELDPSGDADADGVMNALDPDSDNDGLFDGTELGFGCDHADTDVARQTCIADADEGATTTDPLNEDTDDGGVKDGSEDFNSNGAVDASEGNPAEESDDAQIVDTDGDGLSDGFENAIASDASDADSDDDGTLDGFEANPTSDTDGDGIINALDADSDGDGLFDGTEMGFDCSGEGTDMHHGQCIPDASPSSTTLALRADSDGGGVLDGVEDANHNGVMDEGETNPNDASDDFNCKIDRECGGVKSGMVCADGTCVAGCRGNGGNGCPEGESCFSSDDTVGTCIPMGQGGAGEGGAGGDSALDGDNSEFAPEADCGCRVPAGSRHDGRGLVAILALGAAVGMRRRRTRR